jgi:hypothetical protein
VSPELLLAAFVGTVVGAVLTAVTVARLVRVAQQPELARAPLVAAAPVTFADAGRAELALEGPLFTTHFRGLSFELIDATGTPLRLDRLWVRTSSGGFTHRRLSIHHVEIPRPGSYELRIAGLDPAVDYADAAVVFVRPHGPGLAVTVVALIVSVWITAAGLAVAGALLVGAIPSADIPLASTPAPPPPAARPSIPDARGGRAVASDPARLAGGQDVVWQILRMRIRVPADWIVRKASETELDLRDPSTSSTFVVAHASPMPSGPTFDDYLRAHVTHAREQLDQRLVDGYATKRLGVVPGVLTLEHRADGSMAMITWTGFQPAQGGSLSVTLLAGAAGSDFAREEPLLGAIVDSIRFE